MASTTPILRRALLYIPGSSPKMLQKSLTFTVDSIAYDLEDSVTLAQKPAARKHIRHILSQLRAPGVRENAVRINSVSSGLALDDLREIVQSPFLAKPRASLLFPSPSLKMCKKGAADMYGYQLPSPNLDAIVLPKCNSPSDLHFLTDVIKHLLPERRPSSPSSPPTSLLSSLPFLNPPKKPLRILALIESALALTSLPAICTATPLLSGLIFAAEDFALDLSLTRTPSLTEFLYARSAIATAARAFNLPSTIDLVCTSYANPSPTQSSSSPSASSSNPSPIETLEKECIDGKNLGFNGKQIIHPSQILTVQRAFSPSEAEIAWAGRILQGSAEAEREGKGAWTMDGKMVDAPVVGKARAVVERAEACGRVERRRGRGKGGWVGSMRGMDGRVDGAVRRVWTGGVGEGQGVNEMGIE